MKRRTRIYYSDAQKAEIWDRWQNGESMHSIGRSFDRFHTSVQRILTADGGVRPRPRTRSVRTLSLSERETLLRGIASKLSIRAIAEQLGRSPSTVSREIQRNGGYAAYRAHNADKAAWDRACRPKTCKLVENPALGGSVASKLQLAWSPEQLTGWLKRTYPGDENHQVSHATIYRSLYIQTRGALKKELLQHLRRTRVARRPRRYTQKTGEQGRIIGAASISERPASAEDRAVPGHWEGDLLCGSNNSQIATLVDRHSRYVLLAIVDNKETETVISALIRHAHKLPQELYKSLTWDRGTEMANHKRFTLATDINVYLCDPYNPWQRGTNEHTNGLLRQYLPKGTDLSVHSQAKLNAIARRLNERPRKTLNFETPADRFNQCVASIG